jgi:hypothetical protein
MAGGVVLWYAGGNPYPPLYSGHTAPSSTTYTQIGTIQVSPGFKAAYPTATDCVVGLSTIHTATNFFLSPCTRVGGGWHSDTLITTAAIEDFTFGNVRFDKTELLFDTKLAEKLTNFLGINLK